jgi:hypothetical protein
LIQNPLGTDREELVGPVHFQAVGVSLVDLFQVWDAPSIYKDTKTLPENKRKTWILILSHARCIISYPGSVHIFNSEIQCMLFLCVPPTYAGA